MQNTGIVVAITMIGNRYTRIFVKLLANELALITPKNL